jgi:hypothetical protein
MSFEFTAFREPFPEWHGPYSPARGTTSGFRIRGGRLKTVVDTEDGREEWIVSQSIGARSLQELVCRQWIGGRVLLLPNGLVIKPSPQGDGQCWVIGQIHGPVVLEAPDGSEFDLHDPGSLEAGDIWPGPTTTGIECVINGSTGALRAEIRIPTPTGCLRGDHEVVGPDGSLARGFKIARPGDHAGRVRVTANGHVITNRNQRGHWECVYVGRINVAKWAHHQEWAYGVIVDRESFLAIEAMTKRLLDIKAVDEFEQGVEETEAAYDQGWSGDQESDLAEVEEVNEVDENQSLLRHRRPDLSTPSTPPAGSLTPPESPLPLAPSPSPDAKTPPTSTPALQTRLNQEPQRGFWSWLASIVKGN